MAELADALVSGTNVSSLCAGSSPVLGTNTFITPIQ